MPVKASKLKELIDKHNDPNNKTRIVSIQGTSISNFFPMRMREGDKILIEDGDIVWKEYSVESKDQPLVYRTGINNIDLVNYISDPADLPIIGNGKLE